MINSRTDCRYHERPYTLSILTLCYSWNGISSERRTILTAAFASREGLLPGKSDVKCKSHVQRVAAIDCTDVEHAPICENCTCKPGSCGSSRPIEMRNAIVDIPIIVLYFQLIILLSKARRAEIFTKEK